MSLLLGGLALGLALASGRAEPQGVYEAPVVAGRARPATARTSAPTRPAASTAKPSVSDPGTPAPMGGAGDPPASAPTSTSSSGAATTPVVAKRRPFAAGEVGIVLTGVGAVACAADANGILTPTPGRQREWEPLPVAKLPLVVVVADPDAEAPLGDARAVIVLDETSMRVRFVSPPPLDSDPIASLVPPASLVGDALADVRLPLDAESRVNSVAGFALLLAGRTLDAMRVLLIGEPSRPTSAGGTPAAPAGTRVLRAYGWLLSKVKQQLPAVHDELMGLGADPDVGPVARLLTGAALLADGNAREAVRDFNAALAVKPGYWPARLLLGAANDRLALPDAAKEAYAAVLAVVPGRPEAVVGYAPHLAATDRPAAVALVEGLLAERPTLVSAWWQLAWLRRTGNTSEDLHREVEAMERVTALRPDDADAWGALGGARSRWAQSGGGAAAQKAASEAFARQCVLAPEDGLAWFNRAATLHQVALETPLDGDASALAPRVAEARDAYAKALARGLSKSDAARVHFNLGLLLDVAPRSAADPASGGLPSTAIDAYAAALGADPGYAEAGLALAAARIGTRDVKASATTLATLPPGVDPREKAVLEAALAHVRGDPAAATRLLAGPAKTPVVGADPLPTLARELLLLGYRRLVVSILGAEDRDAARLALRVRARAGLCDVTGTRADLVALRALDPAKADDLARNDADVRRTLGPK